MVTSLGFFGNGHHTGHSLALHMSTEQGDLIQRIDPDETNGTWRIKAGSPGSYMGIAQTQAAVSVAI